MNIYITNSETKFMFIIAFISFFVGDIISTYYALSVGGVEGNAVLSCVSFETMILLKILFMIVLYVFVIYLKEHNFERGLLLGAVIAVGLFVTLGNIGFYGGMK